MSRLSGRTAIVTGAARGIGAAYARGMAAEGAAVCLCDITDPAPVVAEIRAAGGEAMGVVVDVTSSAAVAAAVKAAEAWHGGLQVLINNAGVFATLTRKPFYEIPSDEWDWVMAVNARGSFEFAKAVAPIMQRQKYGKIVNIASGTLFKGSTGMMQYVASKGAVVAMTRVMARELGADNICVNCIAPGLTLSEGVTESAIHMAGVPANAASRCFQREEKPQDLVGAVLFFSSAESDFVTGQTLLVDGGAVFKLMRVAVLALLLVAAAFVLPNAAGAVDPYVIHAIVPLTGPNAFLGKGEAATLNAIEGLVNKRGGVRGRPIAFSIQDDSSDPVKSVQIINQLAAQNVPFVLGPSGVQSCSAAMPILANSGPLQYCFSNGVHAIPGSYEFSSAPSSEDMVAVAVRYMHQRGWTRIAIIASIDASGQDGERSILAQIARPENQGFTVVAREHFAPADISVSAQMTRIADAKPQVIYAWSTGTPMATILRAFSEEGFHVPLFTTAGNLTYVQMEQYKSYLTSDVYFGAPPQFGPNAIASDRALKNSVDTFLATMKGVGIKADYGPVAAWDPTMLVIDALQRFGFDLTGAQLRTYVAGLKGWVGADGRYDFVANPQRGLNAGNCLVVRWDAGRDTWVGVSKLGGAPL